MGECVICHYWYFLDNEFKLQSSPCNACHDVLMMSITLNTHGLDYRCIIIAISKSKAIKIIQKLKKP